MKIGPVDSGDRPQRPNEEERRRADVKREEQQQMNKTDRIELSKVARSLSQKTSEVSDDKLETPPAANPDAPEEIPELEDRPDKIEEVKKKIESGYYDSPEGIEKTAGRIADDFIG